MAINVGAAIAYLELDTSNFSESLRGAGEDLESFASSGEVIIAVGDTMDEVSLSAQNLNMSLQDTAVAVSNMVISIASSIMELKICLSELKEAIIEIMEAVKNLADALLEGLVNALNKVKDLVKSGIFTLLYDEIMKVRDALSSLISQASKIGILEEAFRNLAKTIEDTSKAARDLSASFEEMKNKIELLTDAVLKLKNRIEELTEAEKADTIQVNNLKGAVTALRESVELCLIPLSLFAAALKLIDYEAKALAKTINEELKPALDSLKEISMSLSVELSGKLITGTKQAGDSAKDLGDKLEDTAEKSGESVGVLASIRKALDPFISKIKEIIEVVEGWIEKFKNIIEILKTIKDFLSNFSKLEKVVGILEKIISVAEKIITPIEKIIDIVKKVIGAFDSLEAAAGVFAEIAGIISPNAVLIVAAIALIGFAVYEVIKHWDDLVAYFKGLGSKFNEFGENISQGFSKGIQDGLEILNDIGQWFKEKIIDPIKALFGIQSPSKVFAEFGGFIIQGLANGLTDGLDSVMETIANIGNGIIDKFKSLLGINSPSKVFAEYGGFIGEGLIQGIDNQEGIITSKFSGIANKIKNLGNVKLEFSRLNNMDLSGAYGGSTAFGASNSKQFNFTPNITMHISVADTGAKGTAQLTSELKTMAQNAIKNSMVDEFMADALRL